MNIIQRFTGVFFSPKETLEKIALRPVWVDALIIIIIALIIFSYLTHPYSLQDQVNLYKNNIKMQERLGEERFQEMLTRLENPNPKNTLLQILIISPLTLLIGFLFSSLILLILGRFFSIEGNYKGVFSVYLHANFIDKILGNGLRLGLILSKKSVMQTTTSLALFFPKLETTSTAFAILSQFDFFQLWLFAVLGYGLAAVFKIDYRKALYVSYGFWFLKSLLYIALSLLGQQMMG